MSARTVPVNVYYRVTWQLLLIVTGALAVASQVVRPQVGLPFFLLSYYLVTSYGASLGRNRTGIALGIAAALILLAANEVMRFGGVDDLVEVMIELSCGALPLILLTHERPTSYWLGALNVSIIAIGCISFTSSVPVYLGFLAFIGLLMLSLNAANLYLPDQTGKALNEDLPPGFFRQFVYVFPSGVGAAVLIFMAFPRVQHFTMSLGNMMGKSKTGYSGVIELSGDGEIEESAALALMVASPDLGWLRVNGPSLLLRGDALDTFDGTRWTSSVFDYKAFNMTPDVRVTTRHAPETKDLTFHIEPTASSAIFYPGVLVAMKGRTTNAGKFMVNANGSVIRDIFSLDRFSYTFRIAPTLPAAALSAAPVAEDLLHLSAARDRQSSPHELTARELDVLRAVPAAVKGAKWFAAWRDELGADPSTDTLADIEERVVEYFWTGFKWSLANKFSGENALESFLTKDKQGHCEYFATATVLYLRSLGIPARVVVGYRGGTYNQLIDTLEVREENAHAWVEAFVPGVGWHAMDPTPPAPSGIAQGVGAKMRTYVNAFSFWFRHYIVDYDQSTQKDLIRSLKNIGRKQKGDKFDWGAAARSVGPWAAIVVILLILGSFVWRRAFSRGEIQRLPGYYLKFAGKMAKAGQERRRGETLGSWHERLIANGADQDLVHTIGAAVERDLYAPEGLTPAERDDVVRLVAGVKV